MNLKEKLITLLLFISFFNSPIQAQHPEFKKMDFLIGEWRFDAKSLMPDGKYQPQEFYSKVEYINGGNSSRDDFHFKNQNGDWMIYGSTVRSYDSQAGKWKMLWYNYNLSFVTQMEGDFRDEEFHFTGKGTDERGSYIEKIVFYDIENDKYSWKGDRSYDDGKTWMKNFFSYTAYRKKAGN